MEPRPRIMAWGFARRGSDGSEAGLDVDSAAAAAVAGQL